MRKKTSAVIVALSLSLAVLGALQFSKPASADGIYCDDLLECKGDKGCPNGGSVSGCSISCSGGGDPVSCEKVELD